MGGRSSSNMRTTSMMLMTSFALCIALTAAEEYSNTDRIVPEVALMKNNVEMELTQIDDEEWTQLRKEVTPEYSADQLARDSALAKVSLLQNNQEASEKLVRETIQGTQRGAAKTQKLISAAKKKRAAKKST